jgi:hypothetical protein
MSAGQELLPRRSLTERFAPPISARLQLVGLTSGGPRGHNRRSETAANAPNDAFTITTNCGRNRRQNRLANTLFWLDLTIFRMNTCTKRVGGWGVPILNSYFNSASRMRVPHPLTLSLEGLALRIERSWRRVGFKGAVSLMPGPGRVPKRRISRTPAAENALSDRGIGCGFSIRQPRGGVQLHPRRDCATVRLKVGVRTSREAAVPCAHL